MCGLWQREKVRTWSNWPDHWSSGKLCSRTTKTDDEDWLTHGIAVDSACVEVVSDVVRQICLHDVNVALTTCLLPLTSHPWSWLQPLSLCLSRAHQPPRSLPLECWVFHVAGCLSWCGVSSSSVSVVEHITHVFSTHLTDLSSDNQHQVITLAAGSTSNLVTHNKRSQLRLNSRTGTEGLPVSSLNWQAITLRLKGTWAVMDAGCKDNRWTASLYTWPLGYSPLVLPPSQEVGSTWVSLSLVGCRCTGKGVFQRNPQS